MHEILRALLLEHSGDSVTEVRRATQQPWSSATFAGARHVFELLVSDVGTVAQVKVQAAAFLDGQFDLPGHIVADLTSSVEQDADATAIIFEVLTVEAV